MEKMVKVNVIIKKRILNAAIACISLVLLTLTSCDACEFSNDYASFKETDTEYKLFLEFDPGSLNNSDAQDIRTTIVKYHQNEYKDKTDMNNDLKIVNQIVQDATIYTAKRDFYVRCVIRDRQDTIVEVRHIRPEI